MLHVRHMLWIAAAISLSSVLGCLSVDDTKHPVLGLFECASDEAPFTCVPSTAKMRIVPIEPPGGTYTETHKIWENIETIVLDGNNTTSVDLWFEIRVSNWPKKLHKYNAYVAQDQEDTATRRAGSFCPRPPCNCRTGNYSKSCSTDPDCGTKGANCVSSKCDQAFFDATDAKFVFNGLAVEGDPTTYESTSTTPHKLVRHQYEVKLSDPAKAVEAAVGSEYVLGIFMLKFNAASGGGCDDASITRLEFDTDKDNILVIDDGSGIDKTIYPQLVGATIICDGDWKY